MRFAAGLAFGLLAGEVGGGLGVQAALGDGEAVQRAVELAVAAAVEAVAVRCARRRRGSAPTPAMRASLASVAKRSTPAISPISLAAVSTPQPRSASSRGASAATRAASSRSSVVDRAGELADAAQLVARDPHARGLLGARQAAGDARPASRGAISARGGISSLGPEVVQVPAQVVDQRACAARRAARGDRPAAGRRARGPASCATGQRVEALAQRGAGDRDGVDRVGLAALARRRCARRPSASARRARPRSPRASRKRSSAPETCRQSSIAHTRSPPSPRAQTQQRPRTTRRLRRAPSARRAPGRSPPRPPRRVCERLCVSAPITIICTVPSLGCLTNGSPADTSQSGRCHAPIKSRRRSSDGGGRHNHPQVRPTADRKSMSQPAAGPRTYRPRRTPPPDPATLALRKSSRLDRSGLLWQSAVRVRVTDGAKAQIAGALRSAALLCR